MRFSSFNGYPDIAHIKGIHFAGLKPWSMKNKSVKSFGKFDDYKLWYYTFIKMCNEVDHVIDNRKIKKLYNQISLMLQDEKYLFYKKYIPHLSHFFE